MKMILQGVLLVYFCMSLFCYAEKLPRTALTLTFVNHSNTTLSYAGATETNQENIFLVSPRIILPGKTVTITSLSNNYNSPNLSGNLTFKDSNGKLHLLHITDPRQMAMVSKKLKHADVFSFVSKADAWKLTASVNKKTSLTEDIFL